MDINKFYVFNLLSEIIVKEVIGPFIITIAPVSLCKFDNLSPTNRLHSHKCYELCFIINGSGEYVHDNILYEIKKGDVIISNPQSSHEIRLFNKYDSSNSYTLDYMFSKYLNLTPKQYINSRKINLAKVYLKMNYKVSDVSSLVGINDISQFSRLFKKHCGISPKSFQNPKVKSHSF